MKKIISFILSVLLLVSLCTVTYAGDNITVNVNGKNISFDVAPKIINGRTMVPLRAIFEALGATVEWDEATKSVFAVRKYANVECKIDSDTLFVNGAERKLDVSPQIVNGRTLVPVRFVAEALGCDVEWNDAKKTVTISSPAEYYTDTSIPSFTSVTGVPLDDVEKEDKNTYNYYEIYNMKSVLDYIDKLKENGWTQAYVENEGDLIIEAYRYKKNLVSIVLNYNQEYRVMDATIVVCYTTDSGYGASNCLDCAKAGHDLCQGHTCSVCSGRGEQRCNGCGGTG